MSDRPSELLKKMQRAFVTLYGREYDFAKAQNAVREETERICALGKVKPSRLLLDPFDRDAEEFQNEKDPYA